MIEEVKQERQEEEDEKGKCGSIAHPTTHTHIHYMAAVPWSHASRLTWEVKRGG